MATPIKKVCVLIPIIFISLEVSAQDSLKVNPGEIKAPQYFAVFVTDLNQAVEWYSKTFSLQELGGSEDENGRWEIMNLRNDHLIVEIIQDNRITITDRALGFFKVGFQVNDVRTIANRFPEEDRPRVIEFDRFGIRIIQIHDPDGNTIQLSSTLE